MSRQFDPAIPAPEVRRSPVGIIVGSIIFLSVVLAVASIIAHYLKFDALAAVLITVTVFLWITLGAIVVHIWTKHETLKSVQVGANIALRSVESVSDAMGNVSSAMGKAASAAKNPGISVLPGSGQKTLPPGGPAMPLPSQMGNWMPGLKSLSGFNAQFDDSAEDDPSTIYQENDHDQ